jgi:hypothetical protein
MRVMAGKSLPGALQEHFMSNPPTINVDKINRDRPNDAKPGQQQGQPQQAQQQQGRADNVQQQQGGPIIAPAPPADPPTAADKQ